MGAITNKIGSSLVETQLQVYAESVMDDEIPDGTDGLKKVHRRILFSNLGNGKAIKSVAFVGNANNYHPHSDKGLYETAARMAQKWVFNPPLLKMIGNNGAYIGGDSAASRYTELEITPFARDCYAKDVHKRALPMVTTEDFDGVEPKQYIPALPMALLIPNITIGYGNGSRTLPLQIDSLCKLIEKYVEHVSKVGTDIPWDYRPYAEHFVPDVPIANIVENAEELIEAYKHGKFKAPVELSGLVDIYPDYIHVSTLPFGVSFAVVDQTIKSAKFWKTDPWAEKYLDSLDNGSTDDEESLVARFIIRPKRNVDIFSTYKWLVSKFRMTFRFTPNPNFILHNRVVQLTPPDIIREWYRARRDTLLVSKRHTLAELTRRLREIETYLIVGDRTDEVISIIKTHEETEASLILQKTFGLTPMQANFLLTFRIKSLSVTGRTELEEKRSQVLLEIDVVKDSFANVNKEIVETAFQLAKKYGDARRAELPEYIGYLKIGDCVIQFSDEEEALNYIERFSGTKYPVSVYRYNASYDTTYINGGPNTKLIKQDMLPKQKISFIESAFTGPKNGYTIRFCEDGSTSYVEGVVTVPDHDGHTCYVTSSTVTTVDKNGRFTKGVKLSTFSKRKTMSSGAKTDIIYAFNESAKPRYMFVYSTGEKNNVTIYRITPETNSITTYVDNDTAIEMFNTKKDIFLNIPDRFLNRCTTKLVYIRDVEELLGDQSKITVSLNKNVSGVRRWS